MGQGNSSRSSHSCAAGGTTSSAKSWTHFWICCWSSLKLSEKSLMELPLVDWENDRHGYRPVTSIPPKELPAVTFWAASSTGADDRAGRGVLDHVSGGDDLVAQPVGGGPILGGPGLVALAGEVEHVGRHLAALDVQLEPQRAGDLAYGGGQRTSSHRVAGVEQSVAAADEGEDERRGPGRVEVAVHRLAEPGDRPGVRLGLRLGPGRGFRSGFG